MGKTIQSSSFGNQLSSEFNSLESLLIAAYGKNKKFDFLESGSIWSSRNDWMMALLKKERTLEAYWDKEEGSSMKDRVSGISLKARGLNAASGYMDLLYEFENVDACIARSKSRRSGTL